MVHAVDLLAAEYSCQHLPDVVADDSPAATVVLRRSRHGLPLLLWSSQEVHAPNLRRLADRDGRQITSVVLGF